MHTNTNMHRTALACIVAGLVGATISGLGSHRSAQAAAQGSQGARPSDMCGIAAGFDVDKSGHEFARALSDAIGCPGPADRH